MNQVKEMKEEDLLQVGDLYMTSDKEMWLVISTKPHLVWWSFIHKKRIEPETRRRYPYTIFSFSENVRATRSGGKLFRGGKLLKEIK